MTLTMDISHICTISQIETFLKNDAGKWKSSAHTKAEVYCWINTLLLKIRYRLLPKKDKRLVKEFIQTVTGYSHVQLKRLIAKHKRGQLKWIQWQKKCAVRDYSDADIALLHATDEVHQLSGVATKKILEREYHRFRNEKYRKLANISVAHIYNLRKSRTYLRQGRVFEKTRARTVNIGIRRKPQPYGKPGYLRVDTVHQGDIVIKRKVHKGVYFINLVDEVTQMEFVFCVQAISERFITAVLEELMAICPFKIINFHSDNGSEFINKFVAAVLNGEKIKQTKSRSKRTNDNALVEGKNGSVIRKHFGYFHIPATEHNASLLNEFCKEWFNPYLNYHRPCGYATVITDQKGKQKKIYKREDYQTPYEKLKSLPNAEQYLKPGFTFVQLDKIAYEYSDTEFAALMQQEKKKTFSLLKLKAS